MISADRSFDDLVHPGDFVEYPKLLAEPPTTPSPPAAELADTSSIEVGDVVIVLLDEPEDDERNWAPAEVVRVTEPGFDCYYYEPSSVDGADGPWSRWGTPPVLSGVYKGL